MILKHVYTITKPPPFEIILPVSSNNNFARIDSICGDINNCTSFSHPSSFQKLSSSLTYNKRSNPNDISDVGKKIKLLIIGSYK